MSSTRYAEDGSPMKENRYASSPEFVEARGISGTAVCARASLLLSERKRGLLYWLQAASLDEGGLRSFAVEFIAAFPERVGSPTMHQVGIQGRKVFPRDAAKSITAELEGDWVPDDAPPPEQERTVEYFLDFCRRKAVRALPAFLTQLCVNPCFGFAAPDDTEDFGEIEQDRIEETTPNASHGWYVHELAMDGCFRDVVGALFEFQRRKQSVQATQFAITSVARKVMDGLDYCLKTRRMVVIDGREGLGKTEAAQAWCRMHPGEARFVSLSGVCSKTSVFRAIARSLGVAVGHSYSTTDIQARVEEFLQRSKLVLVMDEAHFLFGQSVRMYSRPELIDWVDTALCNQKVPVALVCTPQFKARMAQVEKQVGWAAGQFRRRVGLYVDLPEKVTEADLELVAKSMLPGASQSVIEALVGYAAPIRQPMSSLGLLIDDSRMVAGRGGRDRITFKDVLEAKERYREPTDKALAKSSPSVKPSRGRRAVEAEVIIAAPLQTSFKGRETHPPESDFTTQEESGVARLPAATIRADYALATVV